MIQFLKDAGLLALGVLAVVVMAIPLMVLCFAMWVVALATRWPGPFVAITMLLVCFLLLR